jgi:hypothetical protein
MENVGMNVEGDQLILTCDLSKNLGASKSGKTTVIGSTGGGQPVPGKDKIIVNLTVYKKK